MRGKDFGKQTASALAFGKDKCKRTIGDVTLPDGVNLNQELVKQWWCWWYRKYAPGDTVLDKLARDARERGGKNYGLTQPVPP